VTRRSAGPSLALCPAPALWLTLALLGCGATRAKTGPSASRDLSTAPFAAGGITEACVTGGPERCFNATDDNCNGVIDEGCGIATGPVQFAIAWQPAEVDVDLLVTDPLGELAEVGRPLSSGLKKQHDCPSREGECRSGNVENVYLDGPEAPRGKYRVRIVLESLGGKNPPIRVRFGARVGSRSEGTEIHLDRPDAVYSAEYEL